MIWSDILDLIWWWCLAKYYSDRVHAKCSFHLLQWQATSQACCCCVNRMIYGGGQLKVNYHLNLDSIWPNCEALVHSTTITLCVTCKNIWRLPCTQYRRLQRHTHLITSGNPTWCPSKEKWLSSFSRRYACMRLVRQCACEENLSNQKSYNKFGSWPCGYVSVYCGTMFMITWSATCTYHLLKLSDTVHDAGHCCSS